MKLNREHCRAIIFYNFRLNNSASINLIQFLVIKLHQVFIDDMVNSTEFVVHSKTNFVKDVQNQLLFRKPLMLCANWYWKIVMWPTYRHETTLGISRPAYIQYCMNIWLSKKFVRVGSHTICQSLKKINQSEWQKCFGNWFKRMQKCIDLNGAYFEKQ